MDFKWQHKSVCWMSIRNTSIMMRLKSLCFRLSPIVMCVSPLNCMAIGWKWHTNNLFSLCTVHTSWKSAKTARLKSILIRNRRTGLCLTWFSFNAEYWIRYSLQSWRSEAITWNFLFSPMIVLMIATVFIVCFGLLQCKVSRLIEKIGQKPHELLSLLVFLARSFEFFLRLECFISLSFSLFLYFFLIFIWLAQKLNFSTSFSFQSHYFFFCFTPTARQLTVNNFFANFLFSLLLYLAKRSRVTKKNSMAFIYFCARKCTFHLDCFGFSVHELSTYIFPRHPIFVLIHHTLTLAQSETRRHIHTRVKWEYMHFLFRCSQFWRL